VIDPNAAVARILTTYDAITVVGASRAPEARAIAEDAGLLYVEDRCLLVERRRLNLDAPGR
jgi:predicted CoA-binding protein